MATLKSPNKQGVVRRLLRFIDKRPRIQWTRGDGLNESSTVTAASMLLGCFQTQFDLAGEVVLIVFTAKGPLDVAKSFVVVAPRKRDAFNLDQIPVSTNASYHGVFLSSVSRSRIVEPIDTRLTRRPCNTSMLSPSACGPDPRPNPLALRNRLDHCETSATSVWAFACAKRQATRAIARSHSSAGDQE